MGEQKVSSASQGLLSLVILEELHGMRRSRAPKDRQHPYDLCEAPVPHALPSPLVFPSQSQPTWEKLNYRVFGFCLKANRDSWKGCVYLGGRGPVWVFGITHWGHRRNGLDPSDSGHVAREEPGVVVGKE